MRNLVYITSLLFWSVIQAAAQNPNALMREGMLSYKKGEYAKSIEQYKSALAKNDKEAISSLSSLPFESYDGKLNKAQFIKYCDKLFSKKTRDCLVKQKPLADKNNYCAFCGDEIFIFEKVKGKYLFTNITPND